METVSFISVESGTDLVLGYAVVAPGDPTQIESLILQRTPKFEPLLEEWERGVKVSFERYGLDETDLLDEVHWNDGAETLRIKTERRTYELDLRKVDRKSLTAMRKMLKKMNYDGRFQLSGV